MKSKIEKRRRVYPHPGREQEPSAAYSGAGFRPNIRDQKRRNNAPRPCIGRQTSRLLDVASPIWITPVGRNMAKGVKIYASAGTLAKARQAYAGFLGKFRVAKAPAPVKLRACSAQTRA